MSAHTEISGAEELTEEQRVASALNALYEIRLQLANLANYFSKPTLLNAGLNLNLAEKHSCQAIEAIEQKFPHLT